MATATLPPEETTAPLTWPAKRDVLGIGISVTNYDEATAAIIAAAQRHEPAIVSAFAVHAVVTAAQQPDLADKVNQFAMITPDGQPVRWALNALHKARLNERVYGPELTLRVCQAAAAAGISIYLYGGTPSVLELLIANLKQQFPELVIAGSEAPPFRALSAEEDAAVVQRIADSGAGIVLIGLGCPKQDLFAAAHRESIRAVQLCVGAAFDFHAGVKKTAPAWMQRRGLEWLFRLCQEPRRLFKRYLVTNSIFASRVMIDWSRRLFRLPAAKTAKN